MEPDEVPTVLQVEGCLRYAVMDAAGKLPHSTPPVHTRIGAVDAFGYTPNHDTRLICVYLLPSAAMDDLAQSLAPTEARTIGARPARAA